MKELNRTKVDRFCIEDSVFLSDLAMLEDKTGVLISIEELFEDKEKIVLVDRKAELFLNGVMLAQRLNDGLYRVYQNDKFLGIGIVKRNLLKRDVIL